MALRGKSPELIQKRLKAFFYGVAGAGKTTCAISFPKPYLIDCEKGSENTQYAEIIKSNGGAVFHTADFDEIVQEVKALLSTEHDYKTLIIDPLTVAYNNLVDRCAAEIKRKSKDKDATGEEFGKHYADAAKHMKRLLNLLLRLDMNVIITSHAKNEYGQGMAVIGQTFDCYKKLDYLFDLVLEVQKAGKKRSAVVKKTRITTFEEMGRIDFDYSTIADLYGKDIIEKSFIAEKLATQEQIKEIYNLVTILHIPAETIEKWLDKANATAFGEMSSENIQKCIDSLSKKLESMKQQEVITND